MSALILSLLAGLPSGLSIQDVVSTNVAPSAWLELGMARRVQQLQSTADPRLAADARDVLAPLAERLGWSAHRAMLDDSSFRILEPEQFDALDAQLPSVQDDQATLLRAVEAVTNSIQPLAVDARVKSRFSLSKKMKRKNLSVSDVDDRLAMRLQLPSTDACFEALRVLESEHEVLPDSVDNYISNPKASGYQALHLTLKLDGGERVEVQLKTPAMHHEAEYGAAAHWKYKLDAATPLVV